MAPGVEQQLSDDEELVRECELARLFSSMREPTTDGDLSDVANRAALTCALTKILAVSPGVNGPPATRRLAYRQLWSKAATRAASMWAKHGTKLWPALAKKQSSRSREAGREVELWRRAAGRATTVWKREPGAVQRALRVGTANSDLAINVSDLARASADAPNSRTDKTARKEPTVELISTGM